MKFNTRIAVALLVVVLAIPAQSFAQQHHHYKLIDLGTFGGPQSYVNPGSGNEFGNFAEVLNQAGAVAGWADTASTDPFPNFCFNEDCFISHTFVSKNGVLTDLGTLPGGASSGSNWISANGLIAGFSENGEIDPLIPGFPELRATLWGNGGITNLGTLPEGGFESIAAAVNSRSQVVGLVTNTVPDPNSMVGTGFQTRAFLWENGAMQDLGTLGGTNAQALLINERGQVVGWSYLNSVPTSSCLQGFAFETGSFIWDKEKGMQDLGNLGGTCTVAEDMNNRGQIVGASNTPGDAGQHAFLWENGKFQDLGGSLEGNFQGAFIVNEHGQTVGFATLPGDATFHAVLWKHVGDMMDLGTLNGDACSFATGINSRLQIAGGSGDCVSTFRAFLWENGTMFDLNALIPANSPLFLQFVETINDRGEIAGTGVDAGGNQHAYLLIPCGAEDIPACEDPRGSAVIPPNNGQTPSLKRPLLPTSVGPILPRPASSRHLMLQMWNRALRTQTGTSIFSSRPESSIPEEKCPGAAVIDTSGTEHLLDPVSILSGRCIEGNGKLTGSCVTHVGVGLDGCIVTSGACKRGATAKKPGVLECCRVTCAKFTVDLATGCSP